MSSRGAYPEFYARGLRELEASQLWALLHDLTNELIFRWGLRRLAERPPPIIEREEALPLHEREAFEESEAEAARREEAHNPRNRGTEEARNPLPSHRAREDERPLRRGSRSRSRSPRGALPRYGNRFDRDALLWRRFGVYIFCWACGPLHIRTCCPPHYDDLIWRWPINTLEKGKLI